MTTTRLTVEDAIAALAPFDGLSPELVRDQVLVGEELSFTAGTQLIDQGELSHGLDFLLEGRIELSSRTGRSDAHYLVFEAPIYYGHEPLLAGMPAPVSGRFVEDSRIYRIPPERFWPMLGACPTILQGLVGSLAQRFQELGSSTQQGARLTSVNTMAAGLAHELNNPAAGAVRAARDLAETVSALTDASLGFEPGDLDRDARARLAAAAHVGGEEARAVRSLDSLDRADREDELVDWLDDVLGGAAAATGPDLVEVGLDRERLEPLLEGLAPRAATAALAWLVQARAAVALADDVAEATTRVSEIVGSLRGYARLDEAPVVEVDLHEGIEATLRILAPKLAPGVEVERDFDPSVPRITAYGAELNQVWTNLVENAGQALGWHGRISIRTRLRGDWISVEVADDGPGIPDADRDRVFDPFFTTRPVGEGVGLGLDIVRRTVVGRHRGEVRLLDSAAGARFEVRLPVEAALPA